MEHMIIAQVKLEEKRCRRVMENANVSISLLIVSFHNIDRPRSNNIQMSQEEFFVLAISFLCDLADIFGSSLLIGCNANFNALDETVLSWYPKNFKIISKGKDKHRDVPVDYFCYYQSESLSYEFEVPKMCRFGHREKYLKQNNNPHPIQFCDAVFKSKF
jgi:hypothetical protein